MWSSDELSLVQKIAPECSFSACPPSGEALRRAGARFCWKTDHDNLGSLQPNHGVLGDRAGRESRANFAHPKIRLKIGMKPRLARRHATHARNHVMLSAIANAAPEEQEA